MTTNRKRFMLGAFVTTVCMGFLLGKLIGGSLTAGFGGMVWSFVAWFIGAVMGQMHNMDEAKQIVADVRQEMQDQQVLMDFEKDDLQRREKLLRKTHKGQVAAICNRVANRIMAKYVPNLSSDTRRQKVFQEVDEIISEEFQREDVENTLVLETEG